MNNSYRDLLQQDAQRPGILRFGGARMALLDIEAGFWALRQHLEALVGRRLANSVLQQAGAVGGASFARAFVGSQPDDGALALRDCIAAYQAAGFGRFEIETLDWPIGRVVVRATDAFEAWAATRHSAEGLVCAYTAGVLVGFVNVVAGRSDVVCVERACQAHGSDACVFEMLPTASAGDAPAVALSPDPALRQQLSLLEILFDRIPMGIAILDQNYDIRRYNPTWADFAKRYAPPSGAPLELGVNYFDLLPGSEPIAQPLFERVLAGESIHQEASRFESGGVVSYWDVVLAPIIEGAKVNGILNATTDATARVQAIEELARTVNVLREREERLALVLRGTNDGIWDWNVETEQVYYSPRWKEMLGYTDDEVADTFDAWRTLIHPDDAAQAVGTVEAYLAGASPQFWLEHRLRHKDGSYRWILARGAAVRDEAGRPTRMVGSHTDITERKLAEASLQRQVAFENIVTGISTKFINLTPEEVDQGIRDALQMLGEFAGVDRSYVFLFSGDRTTMSCAHEWCAGEVAPQMEWMQNMPVDALPWLSRQLLNLEMLYVSSPADLPPAAAAERAEFARQDIQSLAAVPMVYRGAPVGFLGFDAVRASKTWSERDLALLKIVGEIVVNALEHRRAQAIQDGQRQFLELLATGGGFSETLHTLVRIIEEQWPGMQALILLLDEDGLHLHLGAAVTLPEEYTASIEGLEIGPLVGSCGTACYLRERVIVENIHTDPRWDGLRDLAVRYGLGACWSEPVLDAEGQVLGTFAMYYRQPRAPTEAELRTIETAAHLVGIAIEHQRARQEVEQAYRLLEQRVQARTRELTTLLQVSQNVVSTLELEQLLGVILDQLNAVIHYDGASILSLEGNAPSNGTPSNGAPFDGALSMTAYRGPLETSHALQIRFQLDGMTLNRRVIEQQKPVIIPDTRDDSEMARLFRQSAGDELDTTYAYIRAWIGLPLIVQGRVIGMLTLDHREPNAYSEQQAELALAFANQAAIAIENARLYQAEQARLYESEQRRKIAEGLRDILVVLNSDRPLQEILEHIIARAVQLLGADSGIVYHLETEAGTLAVQAGYQAPVELMALEHIPLPAGGALQQMFGREPYVMPNIRSHLSQTSIGPAFSEPALARWLDILLHNYQAYLGVPLVIGNEVYGSLGLYYTEPQQFEGEEIELGMSLANQAVLAIENARLRVQAERAAVSAERNRIARELHDSVSQALYGIALGTRTVRTLVDRQPLEDNIKTTLANPLEYVLSLADAGLAEMRALIFELRPDALEKEGLVVALTKQAEAVRARHKLDVRTELCDEPSALSLTTKEALYRVAQEALNNLIKHAHATRVDLRLDCSADALTLEVQDDGVGFDPQAEYLGHMGLHTMRERVVRLGGALHIESAPGQGTTVQVSLPV